MPPHTTRVRIPVSDEAELASRWAATLAARGLFVRHDRPPPMGERVEVTFAASSGEPLSVVSGAVVHSRPATMPGETTAGMGLQLDRFDEVAARLIAEHRAKGGKGAVATAGEGIRLESLTGPESAGLTLGIDLGTTYCCVAVVGADGNPRVLRDDGAETIPSVIFVNPDKKVIVGQKALERMVLQPRRAVYGSKRFLGRPYASREVGAFAHFFNYTLTAGKTGLAAAKLEGLVVPLETVAAYILAHLKGVAARELGETVSRAIVTVPAYFGEHQREAVRRAGKLARLEVVRILSEPTAAAVAFGYGRGLHKTILVYDFGGGTFDATVLRLQGNQMEVLASDGDAFLGGCDIDDRLTEYVLMQVERQHGESLRQDPVAVQRIRLAVERAKRELSDAPRTTVEIPYLRRTERGSFDLKVVLEADTLRALSEDLVTRTLTIVQSALDRAKVRSDQLDDIIMVGGQSRSPVVRELLQQRFGRQPSRNVHPDHAVAIGAALVGAAQAAKVELELTDVLPASLRLARPGGGSEVLVARGAKLPASHQFTVDTVADENGLPEFRIELVSGEADAAGGNTPVGQVKLPSSLALALVKSKAEVRVDIDPQGLMRLSARHPTSGRIEELQVTLPRAAPATGEDYLEVDEAQVKNL